MSLSALALLGWAVAAASSALALVAWRRLVRRMEIVARASHELRGPITAATLGLRLGELSSSRRRGLELELGRAGLALEDLAVAAGAPRRLRAVELVDVEQLLRDSVEAWRAAAAERGCELEAGWTGIPANVLGDRLRLAQATGNLIANAIEHGGGAVQVRGHAEAAVVRLEVVDGGPGLPGPVGELMRRPRGPRGRGLEIATAIVTDHGGRLAAAPSERGARVVLSLPIAAPEPGAATEAPGAARA